MLGFKITWHDEAWVTVRCGAYIAELRLAEGRVKTNIVSTYHGDEVEPLLIAGMLVVTDSVAMLLEKGKHDSIKFLADGAGNKPVTVVQREFLFRTDA